MQVKPRVRVIKDERLFQSPAFFKSLSRRRDTWMGSLVATVLTNSEPKSDGSGSSCNRPEIMYSHTQGMMRFGVVKATAVRRHMPGALKWAYFRSCEGVTYL